MEEAIESGDRAFMTLRHIGRGEASGVDVDTRVYHAVTVRDGLIVRHSFSSQARQAIMQAAASTPAERTRQESIAIASRERQKLRRLAAARDGSR